MKKIVLVLCILSLSAGAFGQQQENFGFKDINFAELCERLEANNNLLLLDVRSKEEYNDQNNSPIGRIKGAKNIPIGRLQLRLNDLREYKDKEIVVYCSHGVRSVGVSNYLIQNGFSNVKNLKGGLTPVVSPKSETSPCEEELLESNSDYYKGIVGVYELPMPNGRKMNLTVFVEDGILQGKYGESSTKDLVPVEGKNDEFEADLGRSKIRFLRNASGEYDRLRIHFGGRAEEGIRIEKDK